jgi:hypothetical protein
MVSSNAVPNKHHAVEAQKVERDLGKIEAASSILADGSLARVRDSVFPCRRREAPRERQPTLGKKLVVLLLLVLLPQRPAEQESAKDGHPDGADAKEGSVGRRIHEFDGTAAARMPQDSRTFGMVTSAP